MDADDAERNGGQPSDEKQGPARGRKSAPGTAPAGRRERLELALRANLARRKDQARARRQNPPPPADRGG